MLGTFVFHMLSIKIFLLTKKIIYDQIFFNIIFFLKTHLNKLESIFEKLCYAIKHSF